MSISIRAFKSGKNRVLASLSGVIGGKEVNVFCRFEGNKGIPQNKMTVEEFDNEVKRLTSVTLNEEQAKFLNNSPVVRHAQTDAMVKNLPPYARTRRIEEGRVDVVFYDEHDHEVVFARMCDIPWPEAREFLNKHYHRSLDLSKKNTPVVFVKRGFRTEPEVKVLQQKVTDGGGEVVYSGARQRNGGSVTVRRKSA